MPKKITSLDLASFIKLRSVHPDLKALVVAVAQTRPLIVLCGHRGKIAQNNAFNGGFSKVEWPNSKHNVFPSLAVDIAPLPIDWGDIRRFCFFAGCVMTTADGLGISIRWGGNFNDDDSFTNDSFFDGVHFELSDA